MTRAKYVLLACAKVDFNYWLVFGIDYFCLANRRRQLRSLIIQQLQSRNTMRQGFESRWHPGAFSAGCAPHTRILTNALRKPKSVYSVSTQKIFILVLWSQIIQYCPKVLSHYSLYFSKKWEIGAANIQGNTVYQENRVCTMVMRLKVNICYGHLYSSTQPELS